MWRPPAPAGAAPWSPRARWAARWCATGCAAACASCFGSGWGNGATVSTQCWSRVLRRPEWHRRSLASLSIQQRSARRLHRRANRPPALMNFLAAESGLLRKAPAHDRAASDRMHTALPAHRAISTCLLPLSAHLLAVRDRGDSGPRRREGLYAGCPAHSSLPSMEPGRRRPCSAPFTGNSGG